MPKQSRKSKTTEGHLSAFSFEDYKSFLKNQVNAERGALTRLAEAAGCQLSYLSRCLSHEIHITSDQAFKIAVYLRMSSLEREYFLTLVELEKSGDPSYREFLKSRLTDLNQKQQDLKNHTSNPILTDDIGQYLYHSNWLYSAIHILVDIPRYRKASDIAAKLQVAEMQVNVILQELIRMGFVKKKSDETYEFSTGSSHTPKESPLAMMYHQNWRQRSVLDSQNPLSDGLHYTNVQTMSAADYQKLKNLMIEAITKIEKIAAPSKPEEMVNINFDIYTV